MAAQTLYTGSDSYGRNVELAQRADGVWFFRQYEWNGYGKGWSKWTLWKNDVTFVKSITNAYDGKVTYLEEGDDSMVEFGFTKLRKTQSNIRLPKAA